MVSRSRSFSFWFAFVLVFATLQRLVLWASYGPVSYSDTHSYFRLAEAVRGGMRAYDGTRTPGYPLLLALAGSQTNVYWIQLGMGILITLLLFWLGWKLSGRAWFGGLVGLAHTLNLGQLLFEANLLTETAATLWVMVAIAGMLIWLHQPGRRSPGLALGLGLSVSLAVLTRPAFVYLPVLLGLFILFAREEKERWLNGRRLLQWLAYGLPVVVLVGGWAAYIDLRYGDLSLSTMTGYHLVQHTGIFFEYVPDRYADLRDTYIRYRDEHIARYGTQTNTIWEAIPEMQRVSGLSFYDLSRTLARISIQLILDHPGLYLRNVLSGWWMFWRAPVYWSPEALRWEPAAPVLRVLILIERGMLLAMNLLFLVSSILVVFWKKIRSYWQVDPFWWCLLSVIWIGSVVQTLLDHGDNPRFLVPMQSLVLFWLLWIGLQTVLHWGQIRPDKTSQPIQAASQQG